MEANSSMVRDIGLRIKSIRQKRGLSQTELAEKAQMSYSALNKAENGKAIIRLDNFIKLCQVLQVAPDDILRLNISSGIKNDHDVIDELLSGCTPSQVSSIIKIVQEFKKSIDEKQL